MIRKRELQRAIETLVAKYHMEFDDLLPWERKVFFKGYEKGKTELV
jgi:hypothetical protein